MNLQYVTTKSQHQPIINYHYATLFNHSEAAHQPLSAILDRHIHHEPRPIIMDHYEPSSFAIIKPHHMAFCQYPGPLAVPEATTKRVWLLGLHLPIG